MLIDVIVPTYRREHCIYDTLKTILAQTHPKLSIIIVDNFGSNYQFNDPRIQYYIYTQAQGAAAARNYGISKAKNDLICFFDDDDYMGPTYLETVVKAFEADKNLKMVTVAMDANKGQRKLRHATPCVITRRQYIEPIWTNSGKLQDQQYYRSIIKKNRWTEKDQKHIDDVFVYVGHSNMGGLRDQNGKY